MCRAAHFYASGVSCLVWQIRTPLRSPRECELCRSNGFRAANPFINQEVVRPVRFHRSSNTSSASGDFLQALIWKDFCVRAYGTWRIHS